MGIVAWAPANRLRMTIFFAATLIAATARGAMASEPAPLMTVLIKAGPIAQGKGDVDVSLKVPRVNVAAGAPLLSLGTFTPGQSQAQAVADLAVTDSDGPVPLIAGGPKDGAWTAGRAVRGEMVVRYRLPVVNAPPISGGPPTNLRIDGDGFSGEGGTIVMQPAVSQPYRVALHWDLAGMGAGAEGVSSYGDGDFELPAGSVKRLGDIVFMAGHLHREPEKGGGAFSAVWLDGAPFDPHPAMHWTGQLHSWMSNWFHDETEPPYRVFLRYNPMNAGGGAAMLHSFIATYGPGVTGDSLKVILGHEMNHTWTDVGLDKWYAEGIAVYSQALLPWRAHLLTTDEYLADLNQTASRYYTNPLKSYPEDQVDDHFWQDTRIRTLPYDRGAMYFAVLNGKIAKASGGKRSVDDLVQAMIDRKRAGEPITDAVWIGMLRKEIGPEGPAIHQSMMTGGLMLPDSDGFGPCFHRVQKKIRKFELGFDPHSLVTPERIIQGLMPDSEAAKAGLRNGDKVTYGVALDAVQGDVHRTFTLHVTRDGQAFPITYLPRGEEVDAYQWERVPGVPDSKCRF